MFDNVRQRGVSKAPYFQGIFDKTVRSSVYYLVSDYPIGDKGSWAMAGFPFFTSYQYNAGSLRACFGSDILTAAILTFRIACNRFLFSMLYSQL